MSFDEFIYQIYNNNNLDDFLINEMSFINIHFQRLILIKFSLEYNNIDYVFNYYDNFYYKFFIAKMIKDENTKIEYLLKINYDIVYDFNKDTYLYDAIIYLQNDCNKLKLVNLISDKDLKSKIYISLKNKNLIKENIDNLTYKDGLTFLLNLSDEEKIEFINKGYYVSKLVCSLSMENFYKVFEFLPDSEKLDCINSIINNTIKNLDSSSVKFEALKKFSTFFPKDTLHSKLSEIYSETDDLNLKWEIQKFINDSAFNVLVNSNKLNIRKDLDYLNPKIYDITLTKNYSIGVELETRHKDYLMFLNQGIMLSDWILKSEPSVSYGVEINSNIMHYNKKSLRQLLFVCNYLRDFGFEVNDECSNHIHIGFDVFKKVEELKTLLELFANNENIFFMLANEKETPLRSYIHGYAKPIAISLEKAIHSHEIRNTRNFYEFIFELQKVQDDRMKAINLLNVFTQNKKTIEFRLSNGQTNYEEILLNIILYLKLVDISLNYKKIDKKFFYYITDVNVPEEERKSLILNLLFGENSALIDKFNERYETNNELNGVLQRKIKPTSQIRFY